MKVREDNHVRLDGVLRAVGSVVRDAGHSPAVVAVHAITHCACEQLEIAGGIRLGKLGDQNARFRADMAAERLAEAAVSAARAPLVRLREDRARRGEWVITEFARSGREDHAGLIGQQSGKRILAAARRLERISAVHFAALQIPRLAGNAQFILRAIVERLEFGVRQRPVGQRRVGRDGGRSIAFDGVGSRAEVVFVEAPGKSAVVDRPASGLIAVIQGRSAAWHRVLSSGRQVTGSLFCIRAKVLTLKVAQFVQPRKILSGEPRTALQANHFHPRFGKFGGNDPAHGSHAHDDDVGF